MSKKRPSRQSIGPEQAVHPGAYIRRTVLAPKKMSVTAAAKIVGVGRPALSNFLNGHVATTSDMAARLERAFGLSAQSLLDMQAAYDAAQARTKGTPANTRAYVPAFLDIKANDVESWATSTISARGRLPVLLRTLVNSTGVDLQKVDFPGNDDSQRPGWDGFVEANDVTPWIPRGVSGWELGTNKDIKSKADQDYGKSVEATSVADRIETTFVFVTPRRWAGKLKWVEEHRKTGQWKDVRAYDASDLEQWLEQSIAGQVWFANETQRHSRGIRSLDQCWSDWANVSEPPLVSSLFAPAIESAQRGMRARLADAPGRPTVVTADSSEEALAFLAQLFGHAGGELADYRDRVLVFDEPNILPKLAQGATNFVAVTSNREVERELARLGSNLHAILVYPRNAANVEPNIVLEPLNPIAFRTSLEEMGFDRDNIETYSKESGRSLTVLRRRMSDVPAIRTPAWVANEQTAASLIPFLLVGAWNSANTADQQILVELSNGRTYESLEKEFQHLARLNDAPVWSAGTFRGVVSKIDLLFAICGSLTREDLERYFRVAKVVLGEDDPALDIPEDQRWWKAAFQGKVREYSGALREGISETLTLLSVHGRQLLRARLGIDPELEAIKLVRGVLTPLTTRTLEANDPDLPTYAEAAPEDFLSILERDLAGATPASLGLLRPVDSGVFGSRCARTGLLWALESLAWNQDTLPRAALILARLAAIEIDDNWANKPINSLLAIFRCWMPQTAASLEQRVAVVKLLAEKFPDVAWRICVDQFSTSSQIGEYSYKPRWRTDAHGFGQPLATWAPIVSFRTQMIDMALRWKGQDRDTLCNLIEHFPDFDDGQRSIVWGLVDTWAQSGVPDMDKAIVREKIRLSIMSRRGAMRLQRRGTSIQPKRASAAYRALEPSDIVIKHEWLFRTMWVEESADERGAEDLDYHKREERVTKERVIALREILSARGIQGVFDLAEMGKAASEIGRLLVSRILKVTEVAEFLFAALPPGANSASWAKCNLIYGGLQALPNDDARTQVLGELRQKLPQGEFARILQLAPFNRSTWTLVDQLDEFHRRTYWDDVECEWRFQNDDELNEAIERLLAVQRPRAAFACVRYKLDIIDPKRLFRLLSEMAVPGGKDKEGQYRLDTHRVETAFKLVANSPELTLEEKARLEFAYLDVLAHYGRGKHGASIPSLEKYVETHPELFVQALVWTYRRHEKGEDPPEWQVPADKIEGLATRGHRLLDTMTRIPGHDHLGVLQLDRLTAWIHEVRQACAELDRADVADICLGKLLSHAPIGSDGVWPCEPVRQLMENIQSNHISKGAYTGLYNARGATWRDEGGAQERALASKYRAWADALRFSHPFVASTLLMAMVKTYEHEADSEDTRADINKRLQ
ncbi:HigA family addiction module antitoxin [Hyphomicrobium sp. LHD-15]|uniref:HigA family addiction module antitoxin n=1 Tax=Hyphomicrobium sp. LHD-15 TaxID=3072142 RepID=UPI00280FE9E4|nr:HigA family addiction module antitoxin [Hyphomicrobium sp. LHD-15]MDQ8700210.1 HigA family addiction module antitoxin [Hyphomicrobium sp. LHD-15]